MKQYIPSRNHNSNFTFLTSYGLTTWGFWLINWRRCSWNLISVPWEQPTLHSALCYCTLMVCMLRVLNAFHAETLSLYHGLMTMPLYRKSEHPYTKALHLSSSIHYFLNCHWITTENSSVSFLFLWYIIQLLTQKQLIKHIFSSRHYYNNTS